MIKKIVLALTAFAFAGLASMAQAHQYETHTASSNGETYQIDMMDIPVEGGRVLARKSRSAIGS